MPSKPEWLRDPAHSAAHGATPVWIYALAVAGAAILGLASSHLVPLLVAAAALLPLWAHVRNVGWRRAATEPSPILFIVVFYLFVFPLRGLVIAARGYSDAFLARGAVSARDMVQILLLASFGTTALVESYYFSVRRFRPRNRRATYDWANAPHPRAVLYLATTLGSLAFAGLAGEIAKYGGIGAAQAALLSHSKTLIASDTSLSGSAWQLFAVPAVWCSAAIAVNRATALSVRILWSAIGLAILAATLLIYGSRLNAVLGFIGAWIVFHYAGRRIPLRVIAVGIPLFLLGSSVLVSARDSASAPRLPIVERYSRIAGYGVLDVSLAVWQRPAPIRSKLVAQQRWVDLPGYFVPSFLWHGRPDINDRRLDVYVAQAVGTANDQATGFPPTYLMEGWLAGGWPAVLFVSLLFGYFLGWADRKLTANAQAITVARLVAYAFVVVAAFTYYKDGDLLATFVGEVRAAIYLAVILVVTRAWPLTVPKRSPALSS